MAGSASAGQTLPGADGVVTVIDIADRIVETVA